MTLFPAASTWSSEAAAAPQPAGARSGELGSRAAGERAVCNHHQPLKQSRERHNRSKHRLSLATCASTLSCHLQGRLPRGARLARAAALGLLAAPERIQISPMMTFLTPNMAAMLSKLSSSSYSSPSHSKPAAPPRAGPALAPAADPRALCSLTKTLLQMHNECQVPINLLKCTTHCLVTLSPKKEPSS